MTQKLEWLISNGPDDVFDDTTTVVPTTPTSYGDPMKLGDLTVAEIKREIAWWDRHKRDFERAIGWEMEARLEAYLKTRQLQAV